MGRIHQGLRRMLAVTPGPTPWRRMAFFGLGVGLSALVCLLTAHPAGAGVAALGAFYVYSFDFGGAFRDRFPTVLAGLLVVVVCAFVGHALSGSAVGKVGAALLLAYLAGLACATGPRIPQIFRFGLVVLLVTAVFPQIGLSRLPYLLLGGGVTFALVGLFELALGPEPALVPVRLAVEARQLTLAQVGHWQFALGYSIVAALGLIVGEALHLARPYWVTVTSIFAMQPDFGQTFVRLFQRMSGTLLAVPLTILALSLGQAPWLVMVVLTVSATVIPVAMGRNYLVGSMVVVVFVIAVVDLAYLPAQNAVALLWLRFIETIIGAGLAMVGTLAIYGMARRDAPLASSA